MAESVSIRIADWMLVNLDALRAATDELERRWELSWEPDVWRRFDRFTNKPPDSTTFIVITQPFLTAHRCITRRGFGAP